MKYKITHLQNSKKTESDNAKFSQMGIYPFEYNYNNHNFLWQISLADIKGDQITLETFPEYERQTMALKGNVVVSQNGQNVTKLEPHQLTKTESNTPTKIFGPCQCYTLLTRLGSASSLEIINPKNSAEEFDFGKIPSPGFNMKTLGFYVEDGYLLVTLDGKDLMLKPGDQLTITSLIDEKINLKYMGEGTSIKSEIFCSYEDGDLGPIPIPEEPATFEDFKTCIYLANSQFRGAKFFFKRKKSEWLDEELSKKINPLNQIGVTTIVFLIGAAIIALTLKDTLTLPQIGIAILIWLVIHCLVVAPLIFFAILPKPIKKHIKKISELTPYEKRVYEFEKKYFTRKAAKIAKKNKLDWPGEDKK